MPLLRSTFPLVTFVLFCSIQSLALQQTLLLHEIPTQNSGEPKFPTIGQSRDDAADDQKEMRGVHLQLYVTNLITGSKR